MQPLTVGAITRHAWQTFKLRPWFFMGVLVVQFFAATIFQIITTFGLGLSGSSEADSALAPLIIHLVANLLFQSLLSAGLITIFIGATKDIAAPRLSMLFTSYHRLLSYIGTCILFGIIVVVGYVLLIIPGIIASFTFLFAPYLVIERGLGPVAALKESARITKGNRLRIVALMGMTGLVMLIGLLCLVIGLVAAVPVAALMAAFMYRALADKTPETPPTPLTGKEIVLLILGMVLPIIALVGIFAAIVLASLGQARAKGQVALTQMNMQFTQLGLELYYDQHQGFPDMLDELASGSGSIVSDPKTFAGFTYAVSPDHKDYTLCAPQDPPAEPLCVTANDSVLKDDASASTQRDL